MDSNQEFVIGPLTGGEAKSLVGMVIGVDPDSIECWAMVAFIHRTKFSHELAISTNLGENRSLICALLNAATSSVRNENASHNWKRCGHPHMLWLRWIRNRSTRNRSGR